MNTDKEKTKEKDLTLKQRKWLKAYFLTNNATQAARDAGYKCNSEEAFRQIGWENLTKLDFAVFLEEAGITDNLLQQTLYDGLKADKPIGAMVLIKNGKDGKPEQILKENEGMIQVADHSVRHKYLETALKVKRRTGEDNQLPNLNITFTREA